MATRASTRATGGWAQAPRRARWTARYDYEVKGSNSGQFGVQMPLTDFYRYNGWTLKFFNTPRQGLHDHWLTLRWAIIEPLTLYGEAHRFRSDFGEPRLRPRERRGPHVVHPGRARPSRLQYARYDPGIGNSPTRPIRKTWLTLTYTY